jgi:hypothetical protein
LSEEITQQQQPQLYTHSIKIEDTAKGIRLSVHVYANDKETAIDETIATYLETKKKAEKEKIPVAPINGNGSA